MTEEPLRYKDAGVDIDAQEEGLRGVKRLARETFTRGVLSEIGLFGGLFALDPEDPRGPVLVASADGVGTKLQVAERAGVAVGSLYQYFNNREGLLTFATQLSASLMTDAFQLIEPYLRDMPLRDALRAYLMGGMEWGDTMTGLIQFVARAAYTGDPALAKNVVQPIADAMLEIIKNLLTLAQQRGELRPDLDLDATARAVNALLIAVGDSQLLPYLNNYFRVTDESMPLERVIDSVVDLIVNGIARQNSQLM
jgi:AcrR family transcriptional regulator